MRYSATVEDERGRQMLVQKLGALKSDTDPLLVYSDRSYAEVMGMLLRDMPTPGMLPLFAEALNQRKPGNKRTMQYFEGAPGAGKTFMSEMIARARTKKGAIKIDCGKKNLGELLFETVLDFGKDRRFYDEFDRRIALYNAATSDEGRARVFHPHSLSVLRSHLGEAFSEDGNTIAIDWKRTNQCLKDGDNYMDSRATLAIVNDGLLDVAKKEGFGDLAGNALGMATQEGPLIRAWNEGRELVLDEFNRGKEGTTASLHTVLQFLAGEIDQVTVENTLKEKGEDVGQTFTFRRSEQKLGFFVTATGNSEEDGSDVNELAGSVSSRIVPKFIPVATVEDWQHRICQILTGLPISTLYHASENDWRKNPEGFRQKLVEWRTLGMSADEAANVPALQINLLRRWEDVLEASEKLARFYFAWSQVVNPDSPLHRSGSLAQLMEEIDERYSSKVAIDFRKVILHINEALEKRPAASGAELSEGVDLGNWNDAPTLPEDLVDEDQSLHFGSRLANIIIGHINATTVEIGKHSLHRQIMQHAVDCGIAPAALLEGRASQRRSVGALLDNNPYESEVPEIRAGLLRDVMCDYLRGMDPKLSADNDDLMSVHTVRGVIDAIRARENENAEVADIGDEDGPAADDAAEDAALTVFNDDLDTLQSKPLVESAVVTAFNAAAKDNGPVAKELLTRNAFLYSIAAPALRHGNLSAIWKRALDRTDLATADNETALGDSLAMAENRSKTGLAVTTVMVSNDNTRGKGRAVPLHLVWDKAQDRLLVVGEGALAAPLLKIFTHTRVQYVDRAQGDAQARIGAALATMSGAGNEKISERLKTAFLMRNMLDSLDDQGKAGLAELLARRDVKSFLPSALLKPSKRALA